MYHTTCKRPGLKVNFSLFMLLTVLSALFFVQFADAAYPLRGEYPNNSYGDAEFKYNRSAANKGIVNCYAKIIDESYHPSAQSEPGGRVCSGTNIDGTPPDERNNMGPWNFLKNGDTGEERILRFYTRETTIFRELQTYKRKELLISLRGTQTPGDMYRDLQALVPGNIAGSNEIANVNYTSDLVDASLGPKASYSGFKIRVSNLAPQIDDELRVLETWKNEGVFDNSIRSIGIKIVGHSLGAVSAELTAYYLNERYRGANSPSGSSFRETDIEVFSFNPPNLSNNLQLPSIMKKMATSCDMNIHQFSHSGISRHTQKGEFDLVHIGPFFGHHIYDQTIADFVFEDPSCAYRGLHSSSFNANHQNVVAGEAEVLVDFSDFNSMQQEVNQGGVVSNTIMNKHMHWQWMKGISSSGESAPVNLIDVATTEQASSWFPERVLNNNFPVENDDDEVHARRLRDSAQWTLCANEGQRCWLPNGTKTLVRFGFWGKYFERYVTDSSIMCNTTAFGGDPTPGWGWSKRCEVMEAPDHLEYNTVKLHLRTNLNRILTTWHGYNISYSFENYATDQNSLQFEPSNDYCVKSGGTIRIRLTDDLSSAFQPGPHGNYLTANPNMTLGATQEVIKNGPYQMPQNNAHQTMFTVINHTDPIGCLENGDVISLRTYLGRYVNAESNFYVNANRWWLGQSEKFTVQGMKKGNDIPYHPQSDMMHHVNNSGQFFMIGN